jgi:hypothetical protein
MIWIKPLLFVKILRGYQKKIHEILRLVDFSKHTMKTNMIYKSDLFQLEKIRT